MRRLLCILLVAAACLCVTACTDNSVVGVWATNSSLGYYFELYDDGTCIMFDENDEWVSSGTYTAFDDHVEFCTDTGDFTWVWDKENHWMVFEAGDTTYYFRLCAPIGSDRD